MGKDGHVVEQGECMASIGASYGFDWRTLWNHPENASLKKLRQDPNVLYPGDVVAVPDRVLREENRATDTRHKFVVKGVPETLRLRLLDEFDHPKADTKYELLIGAQTITGVTNGDGELRERIPPVVTEARLFVGEERREIALRIGALDPLKEISGVQSRLANLGYDTGPIDGVVGPHTRQAIIEFQEQYGLEPTGGLDDRTLAKLKERHGH
ncbi:MAG: peptidoglycan-binding protein [Acidobacteriota bacterium]|nr:peptidoglycan-binding protein [Acidobacteriota bacterium]